MILDRRPTVVTVGPRSSKLADRQAAKALAELIIGGMLGSMPVGSMPVGSMPVGADDGRDSRNDVSGMTPPNQYPFYKSHEKRSSALRLGPLTCGNGSGGRI